MANTYQFVSRTSQSASVATTVVVTSGAGQAIPRGSLVVLRFANSSGVLPTSVTDSAGHTYALADSVVNSRVAALYYCVTKKALPAGATFTANVAATSSSRMLDVLWCSRPNGTTATVLDTAASNATGVAHASGTGTAVATAAITPSGANSLLVSLQTDAGAASSTPAASWTEDSDTLVTAAVLHFESQTRVLAAASSVAAGATLASSFAWEQTYAIFKLKPPVAYVKTALWNNTSSPPSTLAATVTQAAAIGDIILVRIFTGGAAPPSACVDSAGNTYVRIDTAGPYGGTGEVYALFRSNLTVAHVASSTTITITGGTTPVFYAGDAIKVTGATSLSIAELTAGTEGTGTTVATPTVVPVTADWLALGEVDSGFTSATPGTTGGTWIEDNDVNGFETQTLISTTFPQSAVGFSATVTPTQTFLDTAWNLLQVDKPVLQVTSVVGSSAASKTESFRAATAGDLLLLIVGTNENSGADNITTPTGWTQLAQSRSGTTNVNLVLFGKIAVGGETSVLATGSATARIQTAFANMGQGYSLTIDVSNTANSTSAVLTGAVGSVTPLTAGGIAISAIVFKNAETTLVAGPVNSTPYDQLGVNNEGSTASTQKVTVAWFYADAVVTTLAYDNAPVATGTAAPYAGLNVVLKPASGTTPATVTPANAASVSASSISITAPSLLGLSSSQLSASALAVTAAAALALSSAQVSASTVAVTAPTFVTLATAAQVSASTAVVTAAVAVVPSTAVQVSTSTLSVTAPARITATATQVSASTLAVTAPTFLALASAQASASTLAVTAPTFVAPSTAASASATTLALTAPAALALSTAASVSATSIFVTAPLLLTLATAVQVSATTASVTVPGQAAVVPSTAAQVSASTLAVTAATGVQLSASPSVSTTTLKVTAPTGLVLATAASVSTSQAFLTSATILALAAAGSVSTTSIQITATPLIVPATAAQVSSTTAKVVVQVFLTLASSQVSATTAVVTATGGATVSPSTASQVSTTSILVTAPTGVVTAVAAQTSATSIAVSAPSSLTLQTAASASSSTLALHSTPQIASTAPSVSSTSLVLGTGAALLPSPAASTATSSLALRAPVQLVLASAAVSASSIFVNSGNSLPPIIDDRNPTVPTYTSTPSSGATSLPVASRVDEGRYVSSNPTAIGLA